VHESGVELADVLRSGRSWTRLRREAGLPTRTGGAHEEHLLKRVRALAHVDDSDRVRLYRRLLADDSPPYSSLDGMEQRFARMLFFVLWPDGGGFASYDDGLATLRGEAAVRDEIRAVIDLAFDQTRHTGLRMSGALAESPLRVHARYTREEIVTALDYAGLGGRAPNSFREGVLYADDWNADAFLVTLRKSENDYSPTTMYRDYAISPTRFHWESQSTTSVESRTGRRYLGGDSNVLLFSRDTKVDAFGTGAPYLFLGPAYYVSHTGDRPIAITWRLAHAMPTDVFTSTSVAAG
jgi:Domain of unknown function (DUF3427)